MEQNIYVYSSFWHLYQTIVYAGFYYDLHYKRYGRIIRLLKAIPAISIVVATGILVGYCSNEIVRIICPIVIVVAQLFQSVIRELNLSKRILDCRSAAHEYETILPDVEYIWHSITRHACTEDSVQKAIRYYKKRMEAIETLLFIDDYLPNIEGINEAASGKCKTYLNTRYGKEIV